MDDAQLTRRICELLGRVPGWLWWEDSDEAYPLTSTGIFYGATQDKPDRAIGVRCYGSTDEDVLSRRVQLRFRGRPHLVDDADVMAGVSFTVLQGLSRVGGISDIRRISSGPLGTDSQGREERSDNYQIILDNPEVLQ